MPNNTFYCSRCQRMRLRCEFTAGELVGKSGTCKECKANYCAWLERAKRDPALIECHRHALLKDQADEEGLALLPDEIKVQRDQRIAEYAQRVEQAGESGDERGWA